MNRDKIIILGSGSSVGVPRIDGYWGRANKNDLKNNRTRCSIYIKYKSLNILIDTSPDIRSQLLKNKITKIDNVIYTHDHADQTHGINELRTFFWKNKKKIKVYTKDLPILENDTQDIIEYVKQINHEETAKCVKIERDFLRVLEGGCTAPIGAIATYNEKEDVIDFTGVLLSIDGKQKLEVTKTVAVSEWKKLGFHTAQEILSNGGIQLMSEIKENLK